MRRLQLPWIVVIGLTGFMIFLGLTLVCMAGLYLYLVQSIKTPLPTLPPAIDVQFSQNRETLPLDAVDSTIFPLIVGEFQRTGRVSDSQYDYKDSNGTTVYLVVRQNVNQAPLTNEVACGDFVLPASVHLGGKFPFSLSNCGGLHFSWINNGWFIDAIIDSSPSSATDLIQFVNTYPY